MSEQKSTGPALAGLVRAGDAQTEAVAITPFVFMARDISNAYLVTPKDGGTDGDLLVNTGFMDNATRNVALLAPHRTGPLRRIVLTQSHADHFGGVPEFREPGTQIIGGPGYNENWADMKRLQPFFAPRSGKLWGATLKRGSTPKPPPEVAPDVIVDRKLAFEQGGRKFVLIHTPEGETTAGLCLWLPDDKIVFTGNLFGPVFPSMPFLCMPRSAIDAELAELAGIEPLIERAQMHLVACRPLECLRLIDVALAAQPKNAGALATKKAALVSLLTASGGGNLPEAMWLRAEIAAVQAARGVT